MKEGVIMSNGNYELIQNQLESYVNNYKKSLIKTLGYSISEEDLKNKSVSDILIKSVSKTLESITNSSTFQSNVNLLDDSVFIDSFLKNLKQYINIILGNYKTVFSKQDMFENVSAQLKTIINFLEVVGYNETDIYDRNVNLQDIEQFFKEQYVNEDFSLNTDKMKNQTEEEKKKKINIFKVIIDMLSTICVILTILDSATAQDIMESIPLVGQAYEIFKQQNISINGHISKKTNVYSYSSLSSQLTDALDYGTPIEVIEYHSGWLKIKYKNAYDEITVGWAQEDNIIWSFYKN